MADLEARVRTSGDGSGPNVIAVVSKVAKDNDVPPAVALSTAYVESGLNPRSIGDGGTSFGLYQLHEGGELGNHSAAWAFNPNNNARTALSRFPVVRSHEPRATWGKVAADSQRPADRAGYAVKVNAVLRDYRKSGLSPADYFASKSPAAAVAGSANVGVKGGAGAGAFAGAAVDGTADISGGSWVQALDSALNPDFGANPFKDTGKVIELVAVRSGFVVAGAILLGMGLLLAFGHDIFGAALAIAAPEAEPEVAAAGAARTAAKHAAAAKQTAGAATEKIAA